MNMISRSAVAGVLALGASGAFAAASPSSGASNLLLVIDNATTNAYYVLDTGITLDSLMPSTSLASGSVLSTSLAGIDKTISASTTLQSFLAANPGSGDVWTLEGGQYAGSVANGTSKIVGNDKGVFTSNFGTIDNANVSAKQLTNLNGFLSRLETDFVTPFNGLTAGTGAEITGTGFTDVEASKYGFFGGNDLAPTGSSALQLFGFTGGGTTGILSSYVLGKATLDASGNLSITGNGTVTPPAVPLPAAVWLFGSGLMGLVGVGRRRKAAAAAAAV